MSYSSIESAKAIVKTSNLSKAESLAANEESFNSKPNVKSANAIPIFNPTTIDNFSNYGKPNAIVRPVIRKNETITPLSGQITVFKPDNSIRINTKENDSFARKLDVKLKHLPKDKKNSSKNVKTTD